MERERIDREGRGENGRRENRRRGKESGWRDRMEGEKRKRERMRGEERKGERTEGEGREKDWEMVRGGCSGDGWDDEGRIKALRN